MSLVILQHVVICLLLIYPASNGATEEVLDECPSIKTVLNTLLSFEEGLDSTEDELNELLKKFPCYEPKRNEDTCVTFGTKKLTQIIYGLLTLCNELRYTRDERIGFVSAAEPKRQIIVIGNPQLQATQHKIQDTTNFKQAKAISPEGVCKEGWSYHNKCCYMMTKDRHSFYTAKVACKSFGGDLASLPDKLERQFVNDLSGGDIYWIGGVRSKGKQFKWLTGEQINNPSWDQTQPNNCCGSDVNCIIVNWKTGKGEWGDAACNMIYKQASRGACKYCPK